MLRSAVPLALIAAAARPTSSLKGRLAPAAALVGYWSYVYAKYRQGGIRRTRQERELLRSVSWEAFWRHYNERVPTIEEEFELWGAYHQHRHEMRYDLVAETLRELAPVGGRILDLGCGSALVADRVRDVPVTYVGFDFGGHHIEYAAKKYRDILDRRLATSFCRGDAQGLPFADDSFDVVVFSEVIEHLLQPELSVWEIARVLRDGGVLIMTTNNAGEVPCRSPLSHFFPWLEKALGVKRPKMISHRPWIWPEKVDRELLPEGSADVYLPHTHHIMEETRTMFAAAGLETFRWSTFEFPPPQAKTSAWLDRRGAAGRRVVDVIEAVAQRTPLVRRLGCHVFMVSRKVREPISPTPPPGIWPGPFSDGNERSLRVLAGLD